MQSSKDNLLDMVGKELGLAIEKLNANVVSQKSSIEALVVQLQSMYSSLQEKGLAEEEGVDVKLRPAYVIMQGIIERAQSSALKNASIKQSKAFVVTPRMPTPLILSEGKDLDSIDITNPQAFAMYRHITMNEFLDLGEVYAVYSHNARTALSSDVAGLGNYDKCLNRYANLKDYPVVKIDMANFPAKITGAMYYVDDFAVTVETRQVTQIDNMNASIWAIKVGEPAKARVNEVDSFFGEHGIGGLGR